VAETGGYDYTLDLMRTLLGHAGVSLEECFVGYLGDAAQLATDLATYQPHLVVLWEQHGALLRAFGTQRRSLDDWAGYVWRAEALAPGVKCIATYAPARLRQEFGLTGTVKFHLARAVREAATDDLAVPTRGVRILTPPHYTAGEVVMMLANRLNPPYPLAIDIEGGCGMGPACIGFAPSAEYAIVVPFYDVDGVSIWDEEDEIKIWQAVAAILEDPRVPKIIQNALYELFVLAWTTGIVVRGVRDDTMLKHFELYCELEKSLEFQASIYTQQPYWKLEHRVVEGRYVPFKNGRRATTEEWLIYNGTDCCVTYEVNEVMERMLKPQQRAHYEFNVSLLVPLVYMSARGIRYDKAKAQERLEETQRTIYELQDEINREAAASESRAALRQFYEALDGSGGDSVERSGLQGSDELAQNGSTDVEGSGQSHKLVLRTSCDDDSTSLVTGTTARPDPAHLRGQENAEGVSGRGNGALCASLIPLLTSAFCAARRVEKREVEEVSWQPMRWNGKKWVKGGKREKDIPDKTADILTGHEEADTTTDKGKIAWQRCSKLITRSIPVAVETLEDVRRFALGSKSEECQQAVRLLRDIAKNGGLQPAQRGELATLLGVGIKLNATGRGKDKRAEDGTTVKGDERDANWFVYEHCKAPPHYKKEKGANTDRLTSSNEAVLLAYIATSDPRLATFMLWRSADTRRESLVKPPDADGRMRCGYNLPGTDTYRIACYTSPTGSGYNLQTVTEDLRDLFLADDGCDLGNFDLRGADGWTLAAECARYGDFTMLHDLQAGLKPVNIIVLLYTEGTHINQLTRDELKLAQKRVAKESWQYIATKPIFYGYSYLMGARKMSAGIAEDSYAETGVPVVVTPKKCEEIMRMIDVRYPGIRRWQEGAGRAMMTEGELRTSVGWRRRFFGRKKDVKNSSKPDRTTHGAWLGTLPQFNTTYATKMGLRRLWNDPENRREDGSLRIEPLHTVHDSLNAQWRVEDREFARSKILPEWFNNPFQVAEQVMVIPASGTFGKTWKDQNFTL
jgi:hypothetical protein